jgi:hypothetical protein
MTTLEKWLEQATRHLSKDSAAQVRTEIQDHYESVREAAVSGGASAEEADRSAVTALGSAKAANCQYRKVLLTSAEARLLRNGNREARAICSRVWLKWMILAAPLAALLAGPAAFAGAAVVTGILVAPLYLPIYTVWRARIYRVAKGAVVVGVFCWILGPDTPRYSWLLAASLGSPVWIEWKRAAIRRKLPVGEWPRQLYL